ncbi:DUF4055 domain-containing protein [Myxococcus sp. CA040A]|uniref:DUF4055 domain-containing protein n=1 Tax=Myxococcus sp. CA040A TaxID=2741738 RepID=UPI00157A5F85|nr:DUF4055 domain-containing protein [Myxococcus sp. CA040A]NTX07074.1 DUF4055 domain-containing protein [Myxococcus sp. CA040A]
MSADVNTPGSAYKAMQDDWTLVLSLLGGTKAMRAAGKTYLPMHPSESSEAYQDRLKRTFLFNYFEAVLSTQAEMPFAKPVKLGDAAPEELRALADDVDSLGNDVTAWARGVFRDGLGKGLTHFLVDYPQVDSERVKTLEDERRAGVRPYFVHVPAESLIAAYAEVVDGKEVLTHVRIRESDVRQEGFSEVAVERVRVLEPAQWWLYEREGTGAWELVGEGPNALGFIPLVTWYAGPRTGFMQAKPPLLALAEKNLEHWQSSSDQRNILTVARFPILAASGVAQEQTAGAGGSGRGDTEDDEVGSAPFKLGPHTLLTTVSPQGKFYYVEHGGAAIAAGRADLETLKEEMAALGMELLVRRTGTTTATEKSINAGQSQSKLQAMAESFGDSLELGFHYAGKWQRLEVPDDALKVAVHTDFGITEEDAAGLELLFKARAAREISRRTFLSEYKRRGVLSADFDADVNADELESEGPALGTFGRAFAARSDGRGGAVPVFAGGVAAVE